MASRIPTSFPRKLQFLFRPKRYKVLWGGRGGAKSWGIARALISIAYNRKVVVLCAREFQNSIRESVHRLLCNQIEEMGLAPWFLITDKNISCPKTGSEFFFAGLRTNIKSIKSVEGVDIVWVEEAETVSALSWETLTPTIRKDGSEIWVSFNPNEESDPTYQKFIVKPPPDAIVVRISWRDNHWFPAALRKEKDYLFSVDPEAAAHVWEGECNTRSQAQIFHGKYISQAFEPDKENWMGPYYGQDFGFSTDPAATVKVWLANNRLWIEAESFGYGVKNDDLPAVIRAVPGADKHIIRADCSRPETIAHMQDRGFRMVPAKKWAGSVEDGISFIRMMEQIVIHPSCRHMMEEARLYRYKVDKITGDVLPVIIDKHNHGWDAVRYALEPIISQQTEGIVTLGEEVHISDSLDQADEVSPWFQHI